MAYSTQSDILEQLSFDELLGLTDDEQDESVNASVVTRVIADADAEIDAYCGKLYALPFSAAPPILLKLSVDMAIYNLYSRRGLVPDFRDVRYRNALKLLANIAKGEVTLGVQPAPDPNSEQAAQTSSNDRIFTRDTMRNF